MLLCSSSCSGADHAACLPEMLKLLNELCAMQVFDYVPPELVSLLVTDIGGHIPSYVYRLLAEYYSREDYTLESKALTESALKA